MCHILHESWLYENHQLQQRINDEIAETIFISILLIFIKFAEVSDKIKMLYISYNTVKNKK